MKTNALRLLEDVKSQLNQIKIPNAEKYEANIIAFLNQCPHDLILQDAQVKWDEKEEFDFRWDTAHLDCRFSIGLEETTWHIWVGINTHNQNDECYQHGIGGIEIDGNEDCFAKIFYETMEWEILICQRM